MQAGAGSFTWAIRLRSGISFSDGSAAYITIGLLLDNEGQSWNDLGLTPDVDAALSSDEQNAYYDYTVDTDPQISKALNTAKMLSGQN